jgi:hypothetical protein
VNDRTQLTLDEKADVVRRVFSHLAQREPDKAITSFHPDAVFDFTRSRGPDRGTFVGHGEIQKSWAKPLGTWVEWALKPDDFLALEDGRVLFSLRGRMVGRDEIELHVSAAHIWTFRHDLVAKADFFQSREDALAAAGLADEPG